MNRATSAHIGPEPDDILASMDLAPLLNAHRYLRVERPPELWPAAIDDVALVRVVGEMIAAALGRGTLLADVVLRVNNVTVEPGDADAADNGHHRGETGRAELAPAPAPGDYVALSVLGQGDWRPEVLWRPGWPGGPLLVNPDLDRAVRAARIPFGYTRSTADGGSVTVFLRRAGADPPK